MEQRIRNIEFIVRENYIDIIQWYPNPFLNKKDDFIKLSNGNYQSQNSYYIVPANVFEAKEHCITIATINIEEEPDVRSIGLRVFELQGQDKVDFECIVKTAYEYAMQLWNNTNNY